MAAPTRNRRWIWFFVFLVVLAVAIPTVMIVVNLGQQLRPEQLAAARERWKKNGPPNYQMKYTIQKGDDASKDVYVVTVRGGRVRAATVNGLAEPPDRFKYYGMSALFEFIDRFLEIDAKGKHRVYARADFGAEDGRLLRFTRRVMGTPQRQEIRLDSLEKLEAGS
jgi:hypothetical protein